MKYEYVAKPPNALTLLENNPRYVTAENYEKLKASMQKDPDFIFARPVIVSKEEDTLLVLAGNMRVRIAIELEWPQIHCCIFYRLPLAKKKRILFLDNLHAGDWDFEALANEWSLDLDIDLSALGFSDYQLDGISAHSMFEEMETPPVETIFTIKTKDKETAESLRQSLMDLLKHYSKATYRVTEKNARKNKS